MKLNQIDRNPQENSNGTQNDCTCSIIIPVFHESHLINTRIEHIYNYQPNKGLEVIIVDGNPQGDTINTIQHKNVITLTSDMGRAKQMNIGASIAHGRILVFLHVDSLLSPKALNRIKKVLQEKVYVGGAFDLHIQSDKLIFKIIAKVASIRSRLTRIPYGDQAIFIRRDYFFKIGGYSNIPLMEDVELMQRIKKRGDRICILSDRVFTSPRRWEKEGIIYTTLRNWLLICLYFLGVSPEKLKKFYDPYRYRA